MYGKNNNLRFSKLFKWTGSAFKGPTLISPWKNILSEQWRGSWHNGSLELVLSFVDILQTQKERQDLKENFKPWPEIIRKKKSWQDSDENQIGKEIEVS